MFGHVQRRMLISFGPKDYVDSREGGYSHHLRFSVA